MMEQTEPAPALASLTDRDRSIILGLAATVLCPGVLIRRMFFRAVAYERYRGRITRLAQLGLVQRGFVDPRGFSVAQGGQILLLTDAGWRLAADLGAGVPPKAVRRQALALPAAVAAAAEAYAVAMLSGALHGGAQWTLQPPVGNGIRPPSAWAVLSLGDRRLALDLDLPGRSYAQVLTRLGMWVPFILERKDVPGAHTSLCYVVHESSRRQRLQAMLAQQAADWSWVTFAHPAVAAEGLLDGAPLDTSH